MRRRFHFALPVLLGIAACSGGSGAPSGPGKPLSLSENEPVPPPRDNPGSGRDNPNGPGVGQGSSSGGPGPSGCPCEGSYTCGGVGADGGSAALIVSASGDTCSWSAGGTPVQLACNGSTTIQGYVYTSSWSGAGIQLCVALQDAGGSQCITCNPG